MSEKYKRILKRFVDKAGHSEFFTDANLDAIAANAPQVLEEWRKAMVEHIKDDVDDWSEYESALLKLALYDIHVLVDDSGSMHQEKRIKHVKQQLQNTIKIDLLFAPDGVKIHFLNQNDSKTVKSVIEFQDMWKGVKFEGVTRLGTELREKIWSPILESGQRLKKPCLVYIFTDGDPTYEDRGELAKSILDCKAKLEAKKYNSSAMAFGIVQIGSDEDAREFLGELEKNKKLNDFLDVSAVDSVENVFREHEGWGKATPHILVIRNLIGAVETSFRGHK